MSGSTENCTPKRSGFQDFLVDFTLLDHLFFNKFTVNRKIKKKH